MRIKKVERLGIKPISKFELEGIMFRKLGEKPFEERKKRIGIKPISKFELEGIMFKKLGEKPFEEKRKE